MTDRAALAFIPARGGSKRLPGKALKVLGGRSLIAWTIETALESGVLDRIVVSSDSEDVLEEAARFDGVEARGRPAELATDESTTMDVLIDFFAQEAFADDDVLCLLQPTSPFRTVDDITATLALLTGDADGSVSVVEMPVPPQTSFALGDGGRCLIEPDSRLAAGNARKQLLEPMYAPNGAVYASRIGWIREHRSFFAGRVLAYVMPPERSLDIDDPYDWRIAECLAGPA